MDRDEDGISGSDEIGDIQPEWKEQLGIEADGSGVEPACSASQEEIDASGIECEFEDRNGSWWCTTHNCEA